MMLDQQFLTQSNVLSSNFFVVLLFYGFLIFIKHELIIAVSTICTLVENISELHLLLQIKAWDGQPANQGTGREGKTTKFWHMRRKPNPTLYCQM
jgi:hypothetical protein